MHDVRRDLSKLFSPLIVVALAAGACNTSVLPIGDDTQNQNAGGAGGDAGSGGASQGGGFAQGGASQGGGFAQGGASPGDGGLCGPTGALCVLAGDCCSNACAGGVCL